MKSGPNHCVAPDRGGITINRANLFTLPPQQVNATVRRRARDAQTILRKRSSLSQVLDTGQDNEQT
jgi:hypothetical protein